MKIEIRKSIDGKIIEKDGSLKGIDFYIPIKNGTNCMECTEVILVDSKTSEAIGSLFIECDRFQNGILVSDIIYKEM